MSTHCDHCDQRISNNQSFMVELDCEVLGRPIALWISVCQRDEKDEDLDLCCHCMQDFLQKHLVDGKPVIIPPTEIAEDDITN